MLEQTTKKRDASATRAAILSAARRAFTEKGFEGAALREVVADAGINVALVSRYFGSKEGLFEEAVIPDLNLDALLDGERATFGERAAAYFCTKTHEGDDLDPTLAFLRSIGSPAVNPMLQAAIEKAVVEKAARWLGGRNAKQRAALIVAHLAGFDMMRRVLGVQALAPTHAARIAPYLAKTLQRYVDDRLQAPFEC